MNFNRFFASFLILALIFLSPNLMLARSSSEEDSSEDKVSTVKKKKSSNCPSHSKKITKKKAFKKKEVPESDSDESNNSDGETKPIKKTTSTNSKKKEPLNAKEEEEIDDVGDQKSYSSTIKIDEIIDGSNVGKISISGFSFYHDGFESLIEDIDAFYESRNTMGFVFDACLFNDDSLNAIKLLLDKYKKDYSRTVFYNCKIKNKKTKVHDLKNSSFFSKKICFKDVSSKK